MTTVGFIGVGVMGGPMARNLLAGDFAVRVCDAEPQAVRRLADAGARPAATPAEAARQADVVITMLPDGPHVRQVVLGDGGVAEGIAADALYIDMSTILPSVTDAVGRALAGRGVAMLDAPVGRGSQQAEEGRLLIMVGGAAEHLERARPVLEAMGDTVVHCGPLGMGSRMKVVNNYLSTALCALTAETLALARASGLETELAVQVMLGTVAGQGHLAATYPHRALKGNLEPGFMVDLAHKDLGLALELAAEHNLPLGTGAAARQLYAVARAQGRGRQDWTSLLPALQALAGRRD